MSFLEKRRPGRPLIVSGNSMGSAAAIFAAKELGHRVHGYILESPYQDLKVAVWNRLDVSLPPGLSHVAYAGMRAVGPLFIPHMDKISPLEAAGGIPDDVPVLILAGDADRLARVDEAQAILGGSAPAASWFFSQAPVTATCTIPTPIFMSERWWSSAARSPTRRGWARRIRCRVRRDNRSTLRLPVHQPIRRCFQIADEISAHGAATLDFGCARLPPGDTSPARAPVGALHDLASLPGDAEIAAEQSLGGGGAQAHDQLGLDALDLRFQPGEASGDLARTGLGMQPPFAARCPFEMLDDIGDIGCFSIDSNVGQGFIEQPPGRADERAALEIFLIAGCLAHKHQPSIDRPFTEHRLGGLAKQLATLAIRRRRPEFFQVASLGHERVMR